MQLRRQPKLKVLVIALLFSGCTTIQPGIRVQDLTEAEQVTAQDETIFEMDEIVPAEESIAPEESINKGDHYEAQAAQIESPWEKAAKALSDADSDESNEVPDIEIDETTKEIILACLLLCNPIGLIFGMYFAMAAVTVGVACTPIAAAKASDHPGGFSGAFGDCFGPY